MKKDMLETALIGTMTTKTDNRIVFFGTCDELSSNIMELTHHLNNSKMNLSISKELEMVVRTLSKIMGVVAGSKSSFNEDDLQYILDLINKYKTSPKVLDHFVLPGQTLLSAKIHVVRTVARRCELAYAKVYEEFGGNDYVFEYLNKLSTLFYELALRSEEEKW